MSNRQEGPRNTPQRPKRPPLTHFLCLPLVNLVSLPQLESSLAIFKQAIPFCPRKENESTLKPLRPLIPDSALRPLGTLHLTLGVMSLGTKERLDEAIEFFQGLDLVQMMWEAERIANANRERKKGVQRVRQMGGSIESGNSSREVSGSDDASSKEAHGESESAIVPKPFTISLESLHALPRARNATVLHAVPVDPTLRLYPFCVMLRDKFLEAGFLQGEYRAATQVQSSDNNIHTESSSQIPAATVDLVVDEPNRNTIPIPRKSKPRPLLLHATVVNTIYVKGRRRGNNNNNNKGLRDNGKFDRNSRNSNQYSFDARDILAHYKDYYRDGDRMQPRRTTIALTRETAPTEQLILEGQEQGDEPRTPKDDDTGALEDCEKRKQVEVVAAEEIKYPFLWAKDFPLEKICICEMGAKKVDLSVSPDSPHDGISSRLGEEYRVVSERSLIFQ
ncbi:hypothetical protein MPDQ_002573 [Monascus purpureus]|uniref:A-kinase anchor protein 7-like phosphoesterase domain-containing protein n=1 Tax=Monascus purpureus TaxID=5098 RepID=A0A507QPM5_MONPU|nr:hypothetical protein MPDQ_002573 [Monascus purpureus]